MNPVPFSPFRFARSGLCCSLAVLASCATGGSASGGSHDTTSDEAAIRKLEQQWSQGAMAKDLDRSTSVYAPDARMMPPNAPPSVGIEQIKKTWSDMFKLPGVSLSFEPTLVRVSPDGQMAYDVGTYTFSMNAPNGGTQRDEGKYVVVWQKRDGTWKAVVDTFNSNLPPPGAH
jgi:uncharacterized protein (TIGR02246 family)